MESSLFLAASRRLSRHGCLVWILFPVFTISCDISQVITSLSFSVLLIIKFVLIMVCHRFLIKASDEIINLSFICIINGSYHFDHHHNFYIIYVFFSFFLFFSFFFFLVHRIKSWGKMGAHTFPILFGAENVTLSSFHLYSRQHICGT